MNEHASHGIGPTPKSIMHDFPVFLATVFCGNAVAMALLVGLGGLILDLPFRSLVVPFLVLAYCGIIFATLLFLARVFRDLWPRLFPLTSGLFMMSYVEVFMIALGYCAVRLRLMSVGQAFGGFAALAGFISIGGFAGGYVGARLIIKARQSD